MPYYYRVPYGLLEKGMRGMPHKSPEEWNLSPGRYLPDVSDIELLPFGQWYDGAESDGISSVVIRDTLLELPETHWAAERLHQALNFTAFGPIVNPARAPLGLVQALESEVGTYLVVPPTLRIHRENGDPKMACFVMSGIVSGSHIRGDGFTSTPISSGRTRTDRRLSLRPLFGEYQRSLAYIGASIGQSSIAYEFDNACISFITRRKEPQHVVGFDIALGAPRAPIPPADTTSGGRLPLRSMMKGPQPFHLTPHDDIRAGAYTASMDFPVALRFETEIPVFDATDPGLSLCKEGGPLWEDILRLPLFREEIPKSALVTVGYTAAVDEARDSPRAPLLTFGIQFVIVHLLSM